MIMSEQMIAWCVIAGLLLCAFIIRAVEERIVQSRHSVHKHGHVIELGKEKEIFYIPGDIDDYDDLDEL